jgi:hypothetical protein
MSESEDIKAGLALYKPLAEVRDELDDCERQIEVRYKHKPAVLAAARVDVAQFAARLHREKVLFVRLLKNGIRYTAYADASPGDHQVKIEFQSDIAAAQLKLNLVGERLARLTREIKAYPTTIARVLLPTD